MTNWIKHDSTEPPALAPAAMVEVIDNYGDDFGPDRVNSFRWKHISHYCSLTDPEGVPYCGEEGLAEDTKYVAANKDGVAMQYTKKPFLNAFFGWMLDANTLSEYAPDTHRHPGDWNDSLMRVWRN